jgi:hypothetical protein
VSWYHNGQLLTPGDHLRVYSCLAAPDQQFHSLHKFNTTPADAGTYSILARCPAGDGWLDAHVLVRGSSRAHHPPRFTSQLKALGRGDKRGEVVLECQVDGYPEPEVLFKWKRPGALELELCPGDHDIGEASVL